MILKTSLATFLGLVLTDYISSLLNSTITLRGLLLDFDPVYLFAILQPLLLVGIPIYNLNYRIRKSLRHYGKTRIERYYFFWIAVNSIITVLGLSLMDFIFWTPLNLNQAIGWGPGFPSFIKQNSWYFLFIGLSALLNRWFVWNNFKAFRQNNSIEIQAR